MRMDVEILTSIMGQNMILKQQSGICVFRATLTFHLSIYVKYSHQLCFAGISVAIQQCQ